MIPPFRLVHTAHSEHFFNAHKAKSRLVTEKRLKSQMGGSCLDLQAGGGAIEQVMHKRIAWGYNRRRTHFQKTC